MPRKQAFSGKQKKKQLQEKKGRKKDSHGLCDDDLVQDASDMTSASGQGQGEVLHVHEQPASGKDFDPNRYRLHFVRVSQEELRRRKAAARNPIAKGTERDLEMSTESVFPPDRCLDFPKRPPWNYGLSKTQLERQEQAYFSKYVQTILSSHDAERLSYFELNLETWRQFWRVTEISDVLLLIADIRYPIIHLPPPLYRYLREELRRDVVIILNKVDMVQPPLVAAWRSCLSCLFPEASVVCFSSFPCRATEENAWSGVHKKQSSKSSVKVLGPQGLLDVCREIVKDKVNLDSWQEKLNSEDTGTSAPEKQDVGALAPRRPGCHGNLEEADGRASSSAELKGTDDVDGLFPGIYQKYGDGILTLGCIGYPNVGKSSLLNGLVGKKVVSVSRTPGHTKHLQTIFLTPTVRLCDCPGLVFPSYVDRSLQVVCGIFPIAQVREPCSVVAYIARHLDLPRLLRLSHPALSPGKTPAPGRCRDLVWSGLDICESWALKCGYRTAKASRPDVYRAANQILRMTAEGRLRLCLTPPTFFDRQGSWETDDFALILSRELSTLARTPSSKASAEDSSESDSESKDSDGERKTEEEEEDESCVDRNPFALLSDDGV